VDFYTTDVITLSSVHLLPAAAIQSVDFSVKSLFMPDLFGAFIFFLNLVLS